MFSIFGTSGPLFRGPLEELNRVSAALGVARTARIDPLVVHLEANAAQTSGVQHRPSAAVLGARAAWSDARQALGEYARQGAAPPPERHALRRVADVMAKQIVTVRDQATVEEGWQILSDAGVGQAPVVNAAGGLVGLFVRAALLRLDRLPGPTQGAVAWQAWLSQPVASLMVTPVPAALPTTDLRRVASVLLSAQLPGMPVLGADDQIIGFVSRSDVLKAVVHDPPLDLWS